MSMSNSIPFEPRPITPFRDLDPSDGMFFLERQCWNGMSSLWETRLEPALVKSCPLWISISVITSVGLYLARDRCNTAESAPCTGFATSLAISLALSLPGICKISSVAAKWLYGKCSKSSPEESLLSHTPAAVGYRSNLSSRASQEVAEGQFVDVIL